MTTALDTADQTDVERLRQRLAESENQLAAAQRKLLDNEQLIEKLESTIADLVRRQWGRSSEKHPGQFELSLFNEAELAAMQAPLDDETDAGGVGPSAPNGAAGADPGASDNHADQANTGVRDKPTRKPPRPRVLPDHLERVVVTHEIERYRRKWCLRC